MKLFYKILNTLNRSKSAYKRFTLSMVLIIISSIFFSFYVITSGEVESLKDPRQIYYRLAWILLMITVAVTFLTIFREALVSSSKDEDDLKRAKYIEIISGLLLVILIYGVYSKLFQQEKFMDYDTKYVYFGVLFFLCIACAYVGKIFNHKNYVAYIFKIIQAGFISLSFSTVLFLGFVATYTLLNKLFDLRIIDKVYTVTFILIYLPFNVGIFLSYFPRIEVALDNYKAGRPFEILITYIIIPIFSIYALILYVYFSKILITAELPKSIIADLVLWFSLLSIFLLFASSVLDGNEIVKRFRKIFPIAMIPIILVMFYSIFIRISDYGLTENRYFVVMAGIYSLICMIYYIFYRDNSNIFILIALSALVFLSIIGPISAYNLSSSSQDARLASILEANDMLNGTEIRARKNIPLEDKVQIKGIVEYLSIKHRSWESKYLPKNFEYNKENFEEVFGFNIEDEYLFSESNEYNFEYDRPIDIAGYDKMLKIDSYTINSQAVGNYFVNIDEGQYTIGYKDGKLEFDLTSFTGKEIFDKMIALRQSKDIVDLEDLAIEGTSHNIKYKIIFTSLGYYGSEQELSNYYMEFYLLTKNID